jgi:hypothetical protein
MSVDRLAATDHAGRFDNEQLAGATDLAVSIQKHTIRVAGVPNETTIDLLLGTTRCLFDRGARDVTVDLVEATVIDPVAVQELITAQRGRGPGSTLHLLLPARLPPRLSVCHLDDGAAGAKH